MKKLLILLLFSPCFLSFSQDKKTLYSGGMLIVQPGQTFASNDHQVIRDGSTAIGGIIRFYFGKCLTAGIYGGSQKTTYISANSENSSFNLGYGGPFFGGSITAGKLRYTASAFIGMGSIKNLHIENQNGNELTEAYLNPYSAFLISPILSIDYSLTKKIALTVQTVCLMGKYDGNKKLTNPTLQVGILFSR
jgi:hypothetical protein